MRLADFALSYYEREVEGIIEGGRVYGRPFELVEKLLTDDEVEDLTAYNLAEIIRGGARFDALDVFRSQYRLAELKAVVARLFSEMDVLVVPTIGTTFTVAEVLAAPIATNTTLGHYTHFGNLLDLCGLVVPAGVTADGRPASVMILGPALSDDLVLAVGAHLADQFDPVTTR